MVLMKQVLGGKVRRCDAKCYKAKGTKCKCICGGRHHHVGLEVAQERLDRFQKLQAAVKEDVSWLVT